jgi:predicted SnoaL-like aldol condensation-catalyzing enzyme
MFMTVHLQFLEGKARTMMETYFAKDYCNHGHLSTRGQKDCQTYEEKLALSKDTNVKPKAGDVIEIPTLASVNGEMVTMYGAGVDIFRVRNGKVMEHWDASPGRPITIKAHDKAFVDNMVKVVAGDPTARVGGPAPSAPTVPAAPSRP